MTCSISLHVDSDGYFTSPSWDESRASGLCVNDGEYVTHMTCSRSFTLYTWHALYLSLYASFHIYTCSTCLYMSHVSYIWVMSLIYESCLIHMSVVHVCVLMMVYVYHGVRVWVMSLIYESCLLYMRHVSYTWVMSHTHESCLLYMSHVSYIWVMSLMYESWLLYMSHVS
jgi:hypothetical protein